MSLSNYSIISTKETPEIICDVSGSILISGVSLPEHPINFYNDLFNWLADFLESKPKKISLHFNLRYLNSTSTRIIFNFLRKIKEYRDDANTFVFIIWEYEQDDDDILELGQEIELITQIPFEYKIA